MDFKQLKNFIKTILLTTWLISCSHMPSGQYVKLEEGEGLTSLSRTYEVPKSLLLLSNKWKEPISGEWYFIPLKRGILEYGYGVPSYYLPVYGPKRGTSLKTDAVFIPFIKEFEQSMQRHTQGRLSSIGNIPIVFGDTGTAAGICRTDFDQNDLNWKKTVVIKMSEWKRYSWANQEVLIFHELGHCFLDRGHDDKMVDNATPKSLMHSSGSYTYYKENQDYYRYELFNPF